MVNEHIEDAESWFRSGKEEVGKNNRVAVAQFTHAMIKALDALFEEKLGKIPSRHENSVEYFKELLRKNKIDGKESKYKRNIQEVLREKNDADYHGAYFSESDAERREKQVRRIIDMVETYV